MILLGLDPGFANLGWCHAEYDDGEKLIVRDMGTVETKKSTKKIPVAWDNSKRTRKLFRHLMALGFISSDDLAPRVSCVCMEAMSYPPNAATAAKLSRAGATIDCMAEALNLPVVQPSPRDIKMAVCGNRKASKHQMGKNLKEFYPEIVDLLKDIPGSRQEHPIDALGAIVASLDSEVVKALSSAHALRYEKDQENQEKGQEIVSLGS